MSASKNIFDALADQVQTLGIGDKTSTDNQSPPSRESGSESLDEPKANSRSTTTKEEGYDDEIIGTDQDGEPEYKWEMNFFNIGDFERTLGHDRIFTRKMLQKVKNAKMSLIQKSKQGAESAQFYIPEPGEIAPGKRLVVGETFEEEDYDNQKVVIRFLSRVEMHPEFQKLRTCSTSVEKLRDMNLEKGESDWLPAPFVLDWTDHNLGSDHVDAALMARRRNQFQDLKKLWEVSALRSQFRKAFQDAPALASKATHIKRIACFGLGTLQFDSCHRELQHLAIFDLATMLGEICRSKIPNPPQIEVTLQDPLYDRKDHILLRELYQNVRFVEDPDGILGIDKDTLVVGAFVPNWFPLMQIVADMFEEGDGPAGFLIDNIQHQHPVKDSGMYRSNDRLSPRASRMMRAYGSYNGAFQDLDLKSELEQLTGRPKRLWLEDMNLYLRR